MEFQAIFEETGFLIHLTLGLELVLRFKQSRLISCVFIEKGMKDFCGYYWVAYHFHFRSSCLQSWFISNTGKNNLATVIHTS